MMGVSDKNKPSQPSQPMATRAKEANKRGLDDVSGSGASGNKKKPLAQSSSTIGAEKNDSSPSAQGGSGSGSPPLGELEQHQPVDTKTLNNHVALIMNKLNNIEGNTNTLNNKVSSLFSKMEDQSTRLKKAETSIATHSRQIGELAKKQSSIIQEVDSSVEDKMKSFKEELRKDNELFRAEIINVTNKKAQQCTGALREEFLEEKGVSREKNLIILGLQESQEGGDDLDLVKTLFKDCLGVSKVDIETLYRMGKPGGTGARPIMVKFHRLPDRKKVWFAKSKLKAYHASKVWLQEDLPKPIKTAQRSLYQTFKKAKSMPNVFRSVQLKGTKLIIDGRAYGEGDLETLPPALHPANLATLHSDQAVIFFGRASPLSNHHPSPFDLEGHRFNSMEQFLAWRRARISGKKALINRALATTNPVICKGILNELRDDSADKWNEILEEIVISGLTAKFTQNPQLAQFLVDTYPKALGEASLNTRWGIGLPLNSPEALDMSKWVEGGNLLGKMLTQVRDTLRV